MSRSDDPLLSDHDIREVQQQVAQQEALVRRMIVRGTPTQAAEDRLRQLQQTLSRMKEQHQRARAFEVQRKMRDHRSR
jgi:predicted nuclease with TOPRIM domain